MTPTLDVAEPDQTVVVKSNHALAACDLLRDIFRRAFGYTGTSLQGGLVDESYNKISVSGFFGFGKLDSDVLDVQFCLLSFRNLIVCILRVMCVCVVARFALGNCWQNYKK